MKRQVRRVAKPRKKRRATAVVKNVPRVHRWMRMEEIAALHPAMADVLAAYGLHCIGCAYSTVETLEEGAMAHGLADDDISALIVDLENALQSPPPTAAAIIVTPDAARALVSIARAEGKDNACLAIVADAQGGFCMEFVDAPSQHDIVIHPDAEHSLIVCASRETISRIGGATIDHREGRFKLDLPRHAACACHDNDATA